MYPTRRSPKVISIIALAFAPMGLLISYLMYTTGNPAWSETPLLVGAIVVAALEVAAAVATLNGNRLGPRLFLVYGIAALALVIADGTYLFAMPAPPDNHHGMGGFFIDLFAGLLGIIFHFIFLVLSTAWPVVAMSIAGWGRRPAPVPFLLPQMR
jgi:hypothetical protein